MLDGSLMALADHPLRTIFRLPRRVSSDYDFRLPRRVSSDSDSAAQHATE